MGAGVTSGGVHGFCGLLALTMRRLDFLAVELFWTPVEAPREKPPEGSPPPEAKPMPAGAAGVGTSRTARERDDTVMMRERAPTTRC